MAYNIVKHRRGTTQEWRELDLIPDDGELVIEECDNGDRRGKIGDGILPFSKLPYITDPVKLELLAEIDSLRNQTASNVDAAVAGLEQTIADVSTTLSTAITQVESNIDTDISALGQGLTELSDKVNGIDAIVHEGIKPSVESLDERYSKKLLEITEQHSADVIALRNTIDTKAAELTNNFEATIEQRLDDSITPAVESLTEDYVSKIAEIDSRMQTEISEDRATLQQHSDSIDTISGSIAELHTALVEKSSEIDTKVAASEARTEISIDGVRESIRQINITLALLKNQNTGSGSVQPDTNSGTVDNSVLLTLVEQLDELQYKVGVLEHNNTLTETDIQKINLELDGLADSIASAVAQQKTSYDVLVGLIKALDAKLSKADTDFAKSVAVSHAEIHEELSKHAVDNSTLYNIIYRIRDELLTQLTAVKTDTYVYIDTQVNDLAQGIINTKADLLTSIDNVKAEAAEELSDAKANISNDINTIKALHGTKIDENKKTLTALATEISENKVATNRELDSIKTSIDSNKADINRNNFAIRGIETDVTNKVSLINTNISALDTRLDAQAERISGILALESGSTTGDAELLDIRKGYDGTNHLSAGDAVRAIGDKIQTLENNLSQYIGTEAIDGLYYDLAGDLDQTRPYTLYLTANNKVIEESGVQIISGAGSGSGGGASSGILKVGYITPSPVVVSMFDKAVLRFTFSGTDSSGDMILQANATWRVNGSIVASSTVKDGDNEFDITEYLKPGTSKVLLTVADDNGSAVTKTWSVQQIELKTESYFDDKQWYIAGEPVTFTYVPTGAIDKTVVFILDGKEIDRVLLSASTSGEEKKYTLPAQRHGAHLLDIYIEAEINGETITSNHTLKDIMWYDADDKLPIIGTATQNIETKQYLTTDIIYTVYDPNTETPSVEIDVIDANGDIVTTKTVTVKPNKDYNGTPTDVYTFSVATAGSYTIKIVCGMTERVIAAIVDNFDIEINPIIEGLAFDFNPVGRSNGDEDRLWSQGNIKMTVSEGFDWINGGYVSNDADGPCFCIKAGSTATIDYKLFADDAKKNGKEFKLVFKTKNVANPNARFLSCVDNTTATNHIGLEMFVHEAYVHGQSGKLELAYSEDDVIEFEFNISKNTKQNNNIPMVMGYEDGVPSRPMVYNDGFNFTQNTPKEIVLGSPDCDLYIYRLKVYNTSLTAKDILDNFIADARSAGEMISRYNRNQIYDENGRLDPDVLAEKCPWLRVYKLSAPHFTNNKSDKVKNTTIQQLYKNGDPKLDNWTCYNAQHSGQGTSSNNYGAAGRNLDFIMNKDDSYFELGDGTIADKITLTRTSVPVAYLNAKVNIASSNNLTNAILAARYNEFNPYRRPFVERDGVNTDWIKDTMEFHNCVIFIQETDKDLSAHREFADTDWHFYAIGNIGDSKKTDKTRLTDPDDKYECCVEIMDVSLPLSAFPVDTMRPAMAYTVDDKNNIKYTWATEKNLGMVETADGQKVKDLEKCILFEFVDGQYIKSLDEVINTEKTYYIEFLEQDDFSEDYTYGWRYISDDEDPDVVSTCKQAWIDFYRFVTTSTDEEFKANLKDYFIVDSALFYYLFTTRYCMVDNRAKNTFWHYGKAADGTRKWDLCWDYDNDTSLGLNNYGKQVYRYGLEDIDYDESGTEVFRQSDSLFFCRIRDLFAEELKTMYQRLEHGEYHSNGKNAWLAETFIEECDKWQNEFPEELWRLDIDRKYIRTYNSSFINGKGDSQFLENMSNGRMKFQRRQWERSQEHYMASKYQTETASGDSANAQFRAGSPADENPVVAPSYQFTLTPYSYMYLSVRYGGTGVTPITRRVTKLGEPIVVPYNGTYNDLIYVYSASDISDFGDLSPMYLSTASIGNAPRVKKLKLGNSIEGYENPNFSSLTTGANTLLEELNIENMTGLTSALDLREMTNLKKFSAKGSGITGVTFADGGKVADVALPAITSLTLKNLRDLTSDKLIIDGYENLTSLIVDGCDQIKKAELLRNCVNANRVRLTDINDFGTVTYEYFAENIFKLKGFDASGANIENAWLTGKVRFDSLTGTQYNEIKKRYPELTIEYDYLRSNLTFVDVDNEGNEIILLEKPIESGADYKDSTPLVTREPSAEFSYELTSWSTTKDTLIVNNEVVIAGEKVLDKYGKPVIYDKDTFDKEAFEKVEGDRILYPVFKATIRNYIVTFKNGDEVLAEIETSYGNDANYFEAGYEVPTKQGVALPELYEFIGWSPEPTNITGPGRVCIAQFAIPDQDSEEGTDDGDTLPGYTIGVLDIPDGYTLNNNNNTMTITACANKYNTVVRIPDYMTIGSKQYKVVGLGGFEGSSQLKMIELPGTLTKLLNKAFLNCINLAEVTLPASIDTLSEKCFSRTAINKIEIPKGVTVVGKNAFDACGQLTTVVLPDTITTLDSTCFHSCSKLSSIGLPNGLSRIMTYVFDTCALETVDIPASVTDLNNHAFGTMPSLKAVTFKTELDGTIKIPSNIHRETFKDSGPIDFNIPWSSIQHERFRNYTNNNVEYTDGDIFFGAKAGSKLIFINEIDPATGKPKEVVKE